MNKSKLLEHLFEKRIDFENNDSFEIPTEVYTASKWSLPSFQLEKEDLNRIKSLLNQFNLEEWSRHTKHRDPSSYIARFVKQKFHPELVTQAWCKFYECLRNYPIVSKEAISSGDFTSVHLCEAPGAFIAALNHFLVSEKIDVQWQWYANSLNPDYEGNSLQEMIPDDRLLRHTSQNWYFGVDCTGDVTKYYNYVDLLKKIENRVWLVTADGSIDCSSDPGNQELHVEYLHYCETMSALQLLKKGGTFVLKIFTSFEDSTICLLYLLNTLFVKVSTFKPASSKSGNSEIYIICMNYKGLNLIEHLWDTLILPYKNGHFDRNKSMFHLNNINKDFLNQLLHISTYFKKKQIERINDNIANFNNESQNETGNLHQTKIHIANRYIHRCKLKSISQSRKLVSLIDVSQFLPNDLKKIEFVNGVFKENVRSIIPMKIKRDLVEIKFGEQIKEVKSSRFCSKDTLIKFKFRSSRNKFLYQTIKRMISESTTLISTDDCDFKTYHEFQKYLFYKIFTSEENHIVLVKVPLLTNFLVGLMYILIASFEQVYLHRSGFLVLYDSSGEFRNTKSILGLIDEAYRSAPKDGAFQCDIFQVVSPNLFYNNRFFEFVWNYNNIVLSKL